MRHPILLDRIFRSMAAERNNSIEQSAAKRRQSLLRGYIKENVMPIAAVWENLYGGFVLGSSKTCAKKECQMSKICAKKELHISAQYAKISVIDRSFLHPPGRIIFSKIILYLHNFSENCVLPERLVPQFRSGKMTTENGRRAAGRDTAERCFDSGFQGGSDRGLMSCRVS